jgi:hypothetical protein
VCLLVGWLVCVGGCVCCCFVVVVFFFFFAFNLSGLLSHLLWFVAGVFLDFVSPRSCLVVARMWNSPMAKVM